MFLNTDGLNCQIPRDFSPKILTLAHVPGTIVGAAVCLTLSIRIVLRNLEILAPSSVGSRKVLLEAVDHQTCASFGATAIQLLFCIPGLNKILTGNQIMELWLITLPGVAALIASLLIDVGRPQHLKVFRRIAETTVLFGNIFSGIVVLTVKRTNLAPGLPSACLWADSYSASAGNSQDIINSLSAPVISAITMIYLIAYGYAVWEPQRQDPRWRNTTKLVFLVLLSAIVTCITVEILVILRACATEKPLPLLFNPVITFIICSIWVIAALRPLAIKRVFPRDYPEDNDEPLADSGITTEATFPPIEFEPENDEARKKN